MKGPSLPITAAASCILHILFFFIAGMVLKMPSSPVQPSSYIVSLVGPETAENIGSDAGVNPAPEDIRLHDSVPEDSRANERISAIAAKKKLERIAKVRSMITLKTAKPDRNRITEISMSGADQITSSADYYTKIQQEIRRQWIFPETAKQVHEVVISVRIMKDGTVVTQDIEKSSGNALFDRSALRALAKASPVSPPPHEMEIGIRFSQ
jgi:TonB family protein